MFTTVVAVLCLLTGPCNEEIITDSSLSEVTMMDCARNQAAVAKWKEEHPIYRDPDWVVARIKCIPGQYQKRRDI